MKKFIIAICLVLILIITVFSIRFIIGGPEDTWLCQNGQWVKHGSPKDPAPTTGCQKEAQDNSQEEKIIVKKPQPNQAVNSPIEISGQARGFWYFEATFPLQLLDLQGNIISSYYAQAQGDWMTEEFVPFTASLEFDVTTQQPATLILKKDNPSGLPEYEDQITIPVILMPSDTMTVKVYFNNSNLDPEYSCNKVFAVERKIKKTVVVGRAALEELLKGVTEEEKNQGYITSINQGVKIQSLKIENGVAYVDFNQQLQYQVGGSCRVAAISAQITETLKQFPTVDSVVISVDGKTEDILQP